MSATAEPDLRSLLGKESPRRFWRSLDELAGKPSFRVALAREFPDIAARFGGATDRRTALKLLGASLLMAGLGACKAPEGIAPYVEQPENTVPGRPKYYATTLPIDGHGIGVLARSNEGRPTKIEGNPAHPASLGGTDAVLQASVWGLYDPSRSRTVRHGTAVGSWAEFQREAAGLREALLPVGGRGFGIVLGRTTSPTLLRQLGELRAEMPELRLYRDAPLGRVAQSRPVYAVEKADVIVSLGYDFLGEGPGKLAYARAFADGRRVRRDSRRMSRLYALDCVPTLTTAAADRTIVVRPSELVGLFSQLAAGVMDGAEGSLATVAADLKASGSRALVLADPEGSASAWSAALAINGELQGPVRYIAAPDQLPGNPGDLYDLSADIRSGRISTLLSLDCDLVYASPGDLDLSSDLQRLARLYHHGLHVDATAELASWHIPSTHALESWSDLRAFDGTASLVQPLIAPLYDGRTAHEVLAALGGDFTSSALDLVRRTWATLSGGQWTEALTIGLVSGTTYPATNPPAPQPLTVESTIPGVELVLRPDPYLGFGEGAANLPLNELPRPLTKQVWGNAAELSPATAARLGVGEGDEVQVERGGRAIRLPVYVMPGMAEETVAVSLGFGRRLGADDTVVGMNAFPLRDRAGGAVDLRVTGNRLRLITTQEHHALEGRDLVREVALADWPGPRPPPHEHASLAANWENPDEAWGMSIDLNACIGCMACVAACQIENNSPVVGPEEVERGHDMHWLRVDRYFAGDPAEPDVLFQPVPCMHCEEAPCEVVCPVNATVHTHDGLNAQVYNRCVGTRYCSQNCPYKVRRFNFAAYQDFSKTPPSRC